MNAVSLARCDDYSPSNVSESLSAALAPLGGMAAFVHPGDRVLLKVNLLSRAAPERAVTTHPEIVRALIREVRSAGGVPSVGDSPGGPNTTGLWKRLSADTGIAAVCTDEEAELVLLDDDVVRVMNPDGKLFGAFTLGRAAVDADVLVSVPKFKTHGFMMFTGAVKNLFGCIPGLEKAQYHLKVPARDDFASMLLDLLLACRPALSVMDAVVGMEGHGPAGGNPRKIGLLMASADAVRLDMVAAALDGFGDREVYTNKVAAERGMAPPGVSDVEVLGMRWEDCAPEGFRLPEKDVTARMPAWLGPRLNRVLMARPELAVPERCTACATCVKSCPVAAVELHEGKVRFDRSRCIYCYCCQELCPAQAIELEVPPLARLASRRR